jgi:hypothetical protein
MLLRLSTALILAAGLFAAAAPADDRLYWEEPVIFDAANAWFPKAIGGESFVAVAWQEHIVSAPGEGQIYLSLTIGDADAGFRTIERFAGPFRYVGKEAPVFSFCLGPGDSIFVVIAPADRELVVLRSDDRGNSFRTVAELRTDDTSVAPRLFRTADGFILFVTENVEDSLEIRYSVSADGERWSRFESLTNDPGLRPTFLPFHLSFEGTEYVTFQTLSGDEERTYQVYLTSSADGGRTWSRPVWLTGFSSRSGDRTVGPERFDNQRPSLAVHGGKPYLVWERSSGMAPKHIYLAEIGPDGTLAGEPEQVTDGIAVCNDPHLISFAGEPYLVWFDNRRGEDNVFLAVKNGVFWRDSRVSTIPGISIFPQAVVFRDSLYLFWTYRAGDDTRLALLAPDRTVEAPAAVPLDFDPNRPVSGNVFTIGVKPPRDSSGVAGYGVLVDRFPETEAPRVLSVLSDSNRIVCETGEDGLWYAHVAVQDYAGNWSKTVHVPFIRDTTPPAPVTVILPEPLEDGSLPSNTFPIEWTPSPDPDTAGYSYALRYVGADALTDEEAAAHEPAPTPGRVMTKNRSVAYRNLDNGTWIFTVRPIDEVGNVGEPSHVLFRLDKYVPVTYITDVRSERDELGRVSLSVSGRGYAEDGTIEEVMIDLDGKPPYDHHFTAGSGGFTVESDRKISGIRLDDTEAGTYRVGVRHPVRGLYFTGPVLTLESSGTVKFGDFRYRYEPSWRQRTVKEPRIRTGEVTVWGITVLLAAVSLLLIVRIGRLMAETRAYRLEVRAILAGTAPRAISKERMFLMRRKGIGLRVKFAFFTMVLVVAIVLMAAIPLGFRMIETQERTLAEGLEQRAAVLLESLAQGARAYLPSGNTLELGLLVQQISAMEEARFATITGAELSGESFDAVWATNDPELEEDLGGVIRPGTHVLTDAVSAALPELAERINREAAEYAGGIVRELDSLYAEALAYAVRSDTEAQARLIELQETIRSLDSRLSETLAGIGSFVGSVPAFDGANLSKDATFFLFYKPIVYRSSGEDAYFRGVVRLGVSTERMLRQIESARDSIVRISVVITLIALLVGALGSLLLASLTIIPIKRLVRGVEIIRDTEDKAELRNHAIRITSRDELAVLAETVNQMTQGLVRAAVANKDLTVGKEVQKMFIPLERDGMGRKLTTGRELTDRVEFFGYYEGAKGVSGDYFDFTKLDDRYYAIIKCDVAGKGVPAALIMVEVATIFLSHFKDWSQHPVPDLTGLVYRMNDLLEERGFKGRFAALTVALLDVVNGECRICNAGDTLIHLYDARSRRMVRKELPKSPAAGVFPSALVELQSPFRQYVQKLNPGDTLFLFTDGLEESKRTFRNAKLEPVTCAEPGLGAEAQHDTHQAGSGYEEFGLERVYELVEAVYNRSRYTLRKHHNHLENEPLEFDFSDCAGTAEEAILALVSVEKVFRIYPDPDALSGDKVQVDRKIDEFLRRCFRQYRAYFSHPVETAEKTEYLYYSHIREDEQYDDLTILGIRMKA